jgi:hypothetical protein
MICFFFHLLASALTSTGDLGDKLDVFTHPNSGHVEDSNLSPPRLLLDVQTRVPFAS